MHVLKGLNHLTFTVSQLDASLEFYRDLLGFQCHVTWEKGAYLSVGDLWLCLSKGQPQPASDYSHCAFTLEADHVSALAKKLTEKNVPHWQPNASEGHSFYILDPDDHQLEIHVGSLQSRLKALKRKPYPGLMWHTTPPA